MKFLPILSLVLFSSCSMLPFIEKEAEELIEYEIAEHMVAKWHEENTEEAAEFREKFLDGFVLRIKKKKWPWGMV